MGRYFFLKKNQSKSRMKSYYCHSSRRVEHPCFPTKAGPRPAGRRTSTKCKTHVHPFERRAQVALDHRGSSTVTACSGPPGSACDAGYNVQARDRGTSPQRTATSPVSSSTSQGRRDGPRTRIDLDTATGVPPSHGSSMHQPGRTSGKIMTQQHE